MKGDEMKWLFAGVIFLCSLSSWGFSQPLPQPDAKWMLTQYWIGQSEDSKGTYEFHTLNCLNDRFAVALMREDQDTEIFFGAWSTDGATFTHDTELKGVFDLDAFDMLSIGSVDFQNSYHIVELTDDRTVYEWRGKSSTRRFEARAVKQVSTKTQLFLLRVACEVSPAIPRE